MPDGPLCAACHAAAIRTRGSCAACGVHRLLPGWTGRDAACARRAPASTRTSLSTVRHQWNLVNGICQWCQLADILDDLLVGDVDLEALRARLLAAVRPDWIVIWLYSRHARELLRGLATGAVPLRAPCGGSRATEVASQGRATTQERTPSGS